MNWPAQLPTDTVDALAYYGAWPFWPVPESDEGGLLRRMDRFGIRAAVILSLAAVFSDAVRANDALAAFARRHPGRFAGMATYDPNRPLTPFNALTRARDAGLRGLALFPAFHDYSLGAEPLVNEALELAGDWRWPIVIPLRLVMCNWIPRTSAEAVVEAARRYPHANFVAAGVHYAQVELLTRAMGELPNLYLEISCIQRTDAVPHLTSRVQAERVLFGTGQPIQMAGCNLVKLADERVEPSDKEAILRTNARRLFGL